MRSITNVRLENQKCDIFVDFPCGSGYYGVVKNCDYNKSQL